MSRKAQFLVDCDELRQSHSCDERCRCFDILSENVEMRFELRDGDSWRAVSIVGNDDYPENTTLLMDEAEPLISRSTVAQAFDELCGRISSASGSGEAARSTRTESDGDLSSESEEDDDAVQLDDLLPVVKQCDVLSRDVAAVQSRQHCKAFANHFERIDYGEITLLVELRNLSKLALDAWQLPEEEPLAIELSGVSFSVYRLSCIVPKVRVFLQSDEKRKFAVGKQLELIVARFLADNWRLQSEAEMKQSKPFLSDLIEYVLERLRNISDYCIICDRPHAMGGLILPSVCFNQLCVFAYDELGLMSDVCSLLVHPEVIDLLIAFLRCAALSARDGVLLDPYPSVRDPTSRERMLLSADEREPDRLRACLDQLSCRKRWFGGSKAADEPKPDGDDVFLRDGLLRWIISSNRTYLLKLKEDQMIDVFKPAHQYLMVTDSPDKEAAFVAAKTQHGGSRFLFHGSPMENWHSILRKGLLNATGTKYQMNGAAYGSGIYLSPSMALSMAYSARSSMFLGGRQIHFKTCEKEECCVADPNLLQTPSVCIAVCEVVDSPELQRSGHGDILVLKEPTHCCTRFLFVFETAQYAATGKLNHLPPPTVEQMRNLIGTYRSSAD